MYYRFDVETTSIRFLPNIDVDPTSNRHRHATQEYNDRAGIIVLTRCYRSSVAGYDFCRIII